MSTATAVAEKDRTARDASVRERPILMSAPMVRAILDGTKTQTRRVVIPQPTSPAVIADHRGVADLCGVEPTLPVWAVWMTDKRREDGEGFVEHGVRCPFGRPGDRLWVRETFQQFFRGQTPAACCYLADAGTHRWRQAASTADAKKSWPGWKPSIHMPRWASRITLELTGVRVERLRAITAEGAVAEGVPSRGIEPPCIASAIMYLHDFEQLWDSLNAKRGYGWDANPWVWVLEFQRVDT